MNACVEMQLLLHVPYVENHALRSVTEQVLHGALTTDRIFAIRPLQRDNTRVFKWVSARLASTPDRGGGIRDKRLKQATPYIADPSSPTPITSSMFCLRCDFVVRKSA